MIGNYARLINKVIKSCIDPELLSAIALQASSLADKENKKEDKEEVDKAFKLELAWSSIKRS